ncbi:hypothetical protein Leryth_026041 [Lithospermum erythrorhizon]|uniref:Uncharacterized protein n=1 Tax=Lithospermum erythrorhizon TaxID=34254 RepID=A0AAV3Q145_LITER|nr:hypothetical protein Leryth_026041 [Lithospermum erythrorhizon]
MNNLSNATLAAAIEDEQQSRCSCCKPIPALAIYVLISLFLIGLSVSFFLLVAVHNAIFLICFLCLSALVVAFLLWNLFNSNRKGALLSYLHSLPHTDLTTALHGDLVKLTGLVACGDVSLESAYERVSRCVYTSTLLYEFELGLTPANVKRSFFQWRLTYCERYSTDFYITDEKSGSRALIKAGPDCKIIPILKESKLVKTTRSCKALSSHLKRWLLERNLSSEARLLRLEEGYVKEGSSVSVVGILQKNGVDNVLTIVQPRDVASTGCLWQKLLLPVDIDGLVMFESLA